MYKRIPFLLLLVFAISLCSCNNNIAQTNKIKNTGSTEAKVKALLATMSLEDKCGEMTQLTIDMISVGSPYNLTEPHQIDKVKLKQVLVDLKVGSILNAGGHAYSQKHWHEIMNSIQDIATKEKKSGIPVLYGIDAIHGTNYTSDATLYPQQLGLAATWNPGLVTKLGKMTAYETRASAIPWTFSPVLDLGRDPRWPRFWEGFGEDPTLAGIMGAAMTEGYQGKDVSNKYQVAACLKHFLGYSMPVTGKDRTSAWIPPRQMEQYVIPPFKAAIDAGIVSVMINSGDINGIPVHTDPKILIDLLRNDLGFKGVAVSDWEDILLLVSRHRVAKDHKEAIKMAINAGVDMSMVPLDLKFPVLLKELVEEGEIPMSRIDEAVGRILTMKFQLGLFDKTHYPMSDYPDFGSKKHMQLAMDAALESITLLKNDDNILPLSKTAKVLVTGPNANSLNVLNGGWTNTWQGDRPEFNTKGKFTILEAIQNKIGKNNVTYVEGAKLEEVVNIDEAVAAAKNVDVVVLCLGEKTYTEIVGNMDDLNLSKAQIELAERLTATGKPVILVLAEGRPRIVSAFEDKMKAAIMLYLPGNEGAPALAEILFGDANPSGKLPFTYPRFANTLIPYYHVGTDLVKSDFSMNAFNPQWEFGHGLSYTSFAYSDLAMSKASIGTTGDFEVSVKVTNTGKRDGMEVVQLYTTDKVASVAPSVKVLRKFEKISLKAGESRTVSFKLNAKDLAFVGRDNKWVVEPGDFEVHVGGISKGFVVE